MWELLVIFLTFFARKMAWPGLLRSQIFKSFSFPPVPAWERVPGFGLIFDMWLPTLTSVWIKINWTVPDFYIIELIFKWLFFISSMLVHNSRNSMEIETENVNYIIYFPGWLNLGNIWLRMLASSPGGGGGGTPIYFLYRDAPTVRVSFSGISHFRVGSSLQISYSPPSIT